MSPREVPEKRASAEDLVHANLDLIGQIVSRVAIRFPRWVDREELWNAGAFGLVEAASRYDPTMGIPFARYAAIRIRGAVLDSTRTRDWVTRSVRREVRELDQASADFTAREGRAPGDEDLAELLGIAPDEVAARQARAASSLLLYLDHETPEQPSLKDQLVDETVEVRPEEALARRELLGTLAEAVNELPGVYGEVVRRYYLNGELLQEISADLGVTEARVSQIRSEGLAALRQFFGSLYDGVPQVSDSEPGKRARAAFLAQLASQSTWRSRLDAAEQPDTSRRETAG